MTPSTDEGNATKLPDAAAPAGEALPPRKALTPAAQRALAEAAARAEQAARAAAERPRELHGRDGPEPTRYGDWERKGILSDF